METEVIISIIGAITGSIGMITGVGALILGILSFRSNYLDSISSYFTQARSEAIVQGKKIIYNSNPQQIEEMLDDFPNKVPDSIIEVINFYHNWGMMLKLHKIPRLHFYNKKGKTASGVAVTKTYLKLKPIIDCYRLNNPEYAEYYIYLYNEIDKHTPPLAPN
ncbi:MAG: hypothetical protein J1F09_01980 [Oscillospiraceae bacterium]|nr:hypothetical protein [Oscillospiraceae bacterium]